MARSFPRPAIFRLPLLPVLMAAVLVTLALGPGLARAAPKAELWERWTRHDPASQQVVDHSRWQGLLDRHLRAAPDGVNRFAYDAVPTADREALALYIASLQETAIDSLNRNEQKAYWINLYNALTVKVILDHLPVKSILDIRISPGLFASGPWGKKLASVAGEALSLDDIEHRILRPIWRDPRVHYAVNCASIGCPNLARTAYTAANTERLLDEQARAFVNHPRGARFENGKLVVSSIYDWFASDFGPNEAAVIAHIARYADGPLAAQLAGARRIDRHEYDWKLNGAIP